MVSEIHIYIEGGGDSNVIRQKLREGFGTFLSELRDIAMSKRIRWRIVACGGRESAYDDFCTALKANPDVFNVLLVDSEEPVKAKSEDPERRLWKHLKLRDDWNCPVGVDDNQCFLMEQSMETWLIADKDALAKFYGQDFLPKAIPANVNIETIDKDKLLQALERATANTKTKGKYHKTKHGFAILALANPSIVRDAAPQCKRLFEIVSSKMGAKIA